MKGDDRIVKALNGLLSDELAAVNEYIVHAEMSENMGYSMFACMVMVRARKEMEHVKRLVERIVFLEGVPNVVVIGGVKIGSDVPAMIVNDLDAEVRSVTAYNEAIGVCLEARDAATRQILEANLQDENDHVNQLEAMQVQIGQMGLENLLGTMVWRSGETGS